MSVKELTVVANTDNLSAVMAFVDERLEELECSMKIQMQIDIAVEEIFVNVAQYAYQHLSPEKRAEGQVTISVEDFQAPLQVAITFTDSGIPFDPLAREDPDVSLSVEQRQIGGLGIFMVKKSMDSMEYAYKDGKNILKFTKEL